MDRAAAIRARLLHPLEPERRPPVLGIDEVLVRAVAPQLVAERGPPERHHRADIRRAGDEQHVLDKVRSAVAPSWRASAADPPGNVDVALAHRAVVVRDREQPDGHAVPAHVDGRDVIVDALELAERPGKSRTHGVRPGCGDRIRPPRPIPTVPPSPSDSSNWLGVIQSVMPDLQRGVPTAVGAAP